MNSEYGVTDNIEIAFQAFHHANPVVYIRLRDLARAWKRHVGDQVGIATLYEQLRYQLAMEKTGDYKLNNDYRALYARLLMENEPELANLFKLRERTTKRLGETK